MKNDTYFDEDLKNIWENVWKKSKSVRKTMFNILNVIGIIMIVFSIISAMFDEYIKRYLSNWSYDTAFSLLIGGVGLILLAPRRIYEKHIRDTITHQHERQDQSRFANIGYTFIAFGLVCIFIFVMVLITPVVRGN